MRIKEQKRKKIVAKVKMKIIKMKFLRHIMMLWIMNSTKLN